MDSVSGSLPPEARKEQAKLFNDSNSEYNVLVATDAVGMGLNLSIKRVVFSSLEKYDGKVTRPLDPSVGSAIALNFKFNCKMFYIIGS